MPKELRGCAVQVAGVLLACGLAFWSRPAAAAAVLGSTVMALVLYYDR